MTSLYFGLCWISVGLSMRLLMVGLWNATLAPSEKGFYGMSFPLSLFGDTPASTEVVPPPGA